MAPRLPRCRHMLPNAQVTLDVFRDGNEKEITATLGELDEEQIAMSGFGGIPRREPDVGLEGVRLRDLDAETRSAIRARPSRSRAST